MKNKWLDVVAGILDGTLLIGTRTPVEGVPAWATLDVAHGGFATGELVAGGALRPHEVALGERLGVTTRGALNRHFLGEAGHGELLAMLRAGTFRIEVPEEGALLATAWMVENDANDEAIAILSAIAPFFERLRFYPVPHERALVPRDARCARAAADAGDADRRPWPGAVRWRELDRGPLDLVQRGVGVERGRLDRSERRVRRGWW